MKGQRSEAMPLSAFDRLKHAGCCGCARPVGDRINLIELRRRAIWEHPISRNVLTGDGPCAVAVCCDQCVDADKLEIRYAVELRGEELVYHPVDELEALGPAPTCVVAHGDRAIMCLVFGRTSYHPEDVLNKYCGHCKAFHPITGEGSV